MFIPTGPQAIAPTSQQGKEGVGGKERNSPEKCSD